MWSPEYNMDKVLSSQNRFRKRLRYQGWDYTKGAWYFITICTQKSIIRFGEVLDSRMILNEAGKLIDQHWHLLPKAFKNIELDEHVVMPNHIHGIIVFAQDNISRGRPCACPASGRPQGSPLLGRVIGAFKSITTDAYIKGVKAKNWPKFDKKFWQRNYYDHIIRNEKGLFEIRKYIRQNPQKWDLDRNNPKNF